MANVTVVGAQWGDEGKGKIVDWLSQRRRLAVCPKSISWRGVADFRRGWETKR